MRGTSEAVQPPRRKVWHYSHADWGKAREKIEAFDWDGMLTEDINLSWDRWYSNFMSIMEECMHTKESPTITKESAMAESRYQKCNEEKKHHLQKDWLQC